MVLATSCELLMENPTLDARSRSQVERVARATEEMRELVKTFLMLARAQRDEGAVASRATLREVADELVGVWRDTIEQKGLALYYDGRVSASPVLYNATFLQSVMGNLLRNAAHYTDSGYIRLSLEANGFSVEDSGVVSRRNSARRCSGRSCAAMSGAVRAWAWACRWYSASAMTKVGMSPSHQPCPTAAVSWST